MEGVSYGNIENRMAYLPEGQDPEDFQGLSVRILRHYALSVRHRQYYGMDIISCHVVDDRRERGERQFFK